MISSRCMNHFQNGSYRPFYIFNVFFISISNFYLAIRIYIKALDFISQVEVYFGPYVGNV